MAAMRRLWDIGDEPLRARGLARPGRRAPRRGSRPTPTCRSDAPDLIASMLAAGYDREAARWVAAVAGWTSDSPTSAGRCSRSARRRRAGLDLSFGRINALHQPRPEPRQEAQRLAGRRPRRARPDRRRAAPTGSTAATASASATATRWTRHDRRLGRAAASRAACWSSPATGFQARELRAAARRRTSTMRSPRSTAPGRTSPRG